MLLFLFTLMYLFTPYWGLGKDWVQKIALATANALAWFPWGQKAALAAGNALAGPPWVQQVVLAATTGLAGLAWAWFASGPVDVRSSRKGFLWFLFALLAVGLLNGPALFADLAWRGDEDHHFKATLMLANVLSRHGYLLLPVLAIPAALLLRPRRGKDGGAVRWWLLPVGALAMATAAAGVAWLRPAFDMNPGGLVVRYPLATNWLAAPLVAVASVFSKAPYPPEPVFRFVPLLSTVLLAWYCSGRAPSLGAVGRAFYILAIATIPTIFYYTSLLYLEMPAILLMTVVCLGAEDLLKSPAGDLPRMPQWYALIFIGFLKDNVPPFLGAVIAARLWFRLREDWKDRAIWRNLWGEIRTAGCIVLPYFAYWFYRTFIVVAQRQYTPHLAGLISAPAYGYMLWGLVDQYAAAAVAFPIAAVYLNWSGQTRTALLLVLGFVFYAALHLMDLESVTGYSRYMLMFAPVLLCSLHHVVESVAARAPKVVPAALIALVGVNLLLSPIHLDGARKPGWGEYRAIWSEHTYPYRAALQYTMHKYPQDTTLVTGYNYPYWFQYYTGNTSRFVKFVVLSEKDESGLVEEVLRLARTDEHGFRHVLYHVLGDKVPAPAETFGFVQERTFQNSSHVLVLYSMPRR